MMGGMGLLTILVLICLLLGIAAPAMYRFVDRRDSNR